MPARARAVGETPARSASASRMLPESTFTMPEIARSVVVFPAPFAPISATTSPASTVIDRPRNTGTLS